MSHDEMLRCSAGYRHATLAGADEANLSAYRRDYAAGADLERQRLAAILRTGARMGQAHYALATSLAFDTDMPPEAALAVLRATPPPAEPAAVATRAATDFSEHMQRCKVALAKSDLAERLAPIETEDDALDYLRRQGEGE